MHAWRLRSGVAIAMLLGLSALCSAGDFGPACTPAGAWTTKIDFDYNLPPPDTGTIKLYLQSPQQFAADGRTINLLPTGPDRPNVGDTRIGCMGEWRPRKGGRPCEFDVFQRCFYNQAWDGIYGEIVGTLKVVRDGKTFVMKFTYINYNGDGTVYYDEGSGVSYGTRLVFPR